MEHVSLLAKSVTDPAEAVAVQLEALESLKTLQRNDVLESLAPSVAREGKVQVKNRLDQLVPGSGVR